MSIKKKICLILCISMIFSVGCGKKDTPVINIEQQNLSSQEEVSSDTSADKENASSEDTSQTINNMINPFSGEALQSPIENRPIAIMINNSKSSLPQRGLANAEIIYELPVEGAITRMMAVFSDYRKVDDIGSVRSARHDFVELIKPYNPIFFHFGQSNIAKDAMKKYGTDNVDGTKHANLAFYQDKGRLGSYASEHTWFAKSSTIAAGVGKIVGGGASKKEIKPIFNFAAEGEDVMQKYTTATDCTSVSLKMSTALTSTFTYDEKTGLYKKGQYGNPHIDTNTGEAISVKNVLIMFADAPVIDSQNHKDVKLENGTGYYISNGKRIVVNFKKSSPDENLQVFDTNGTPIKINVGKTYVAISPSQYKNNIAL